MNGHRAAETRLTEPGLQIEWHSGGAGESRLPRPFWDEGSRHFGEIKADLRRSGAPCGPYDMLIGAHARALGMTLVTSNRREFERMPGLKVENWVG